MGYDDFTIASIYIFFLRIIKDRFLEAARCNIAFQRPLHHDY